MHYQNVTTVTQSTPIEDQKKKKNLAKRQAKCPVTVMQNQKPYKEKKARRKYAKY